MYIFFFVNIIANNKKRMCVEYILLNTICSCIVFVSFFIQFMKIWIKNIHTQIVIYLLYETMHMLYESSKVEIDMMRKLLDVYKNKHELIILTECLPDSSCVDSCVICLSELNKNACIKLQCNHLFHTQCVKDIINVNLRFCPLCRRDIK